MRTIPALLTAAACTAALAACDAIGPDPVTFSGSYDLVTIDDAALPESVTTTLFLKMYAQEGTLELTPTSYYLSITGPMGAGTQGVTLATGGSYRSSGANGLRAYDAYGMVWPDSATIVTGRLATVGAHSFRFTRAP